MYVRMPLRMSVDYVLLFIRNDFTRYLAQSSMCDLRENSRPLSSICCAFRCLTEAVPLSNLRGSKVQVVNRLGCLMQILSLCARSRLPKLPYICLLV